MRRAPLVLLLLAVAHAAPPPDPDPDREARGVRRWLERTLLVLTPVEGGVRVVTEQRRGEQGREQVVAPGGELRRLIDPAALQVVELIGVDDTGIRARYRVVRRPPGGPEERGEGTFEVAFTPPLLVAVATGDRATVAARLAAGDDPDQSGHLGRPALAVAAWRGDATITQALLDAGATVDHTDPMGVTALMRAVAQPDTFARLLAAGADPRRRDARGQTVWTAAIRHGDAVDALIEAAPGQATLNAALRLASAAGPREVVARLLAAGADPVAPPTDLAGHPATGYFALPIVDYARRRTDGEALAVEALLVAAGAPAPAMPAPTGEE